MKKKDLLQGEKESILIELSRIYFVATTWYKSSSAGNYSSLLNTMNHIKFNDCKASLLEEGLREVNY
jgi:hypothetical protein